MYKMLKHEGHLSVKKYMYYLTIAPRVKNV